MIGNDINNLVTPLAVDDITAMDITHMSMAIYSFSCSFQGHPLICHLFPQTPYGISMEPDSKVTDKSDRIFFETHHGHTSLVYLAEDDSHNDL